MTLQEQDITSNGISLHVYRTKADRPTLLITADLDKGAIYPPELADKWVATLPDAGHINIPGAGHNIRREQPAAFLAAVRGFLAGC